MLCSIVLNFHPTTFPGFFPSLTSFRSSKGKEWEEGAVQGRSQKKIRTEAISTVEFPA